jgi:hypothetical protein
MSPPPVFRGSTAQVQGLYPWLLGGGLPPLALGSGSTAWAGSSFTCHPLAWLAAWASQQPEPRRHRRPRRGQVRHHQGRRAAADALWGADVRRRGPEERVRAAGAGAGHPARRARPRPARAAEPAGRRPLGDNLPADPAQLGDRLAEIHRRRLVLLCSLAAMRLGRELTPTEEGAVSLAIAEASGGGLTSPPPRGRGWPGARGSTPGQPHHPRCLGRPPCHPTFTAPIQVIDLSRMADRGDDAIAMILACVSSWAQAVIDAPGPARVIVRDEPWRSLRIPALVRKVDSDLRPSRAQGTIQVLATHRLADFEAAGAAGSAEAAIAASRLARLGTALRAHAAQAVPDTTDTAMPVLRYPATDLDMIAERLAAVGALAAQDAAERVASAAGPTEAGDEEPGGERRRTSVAAGCLHRGISRRRDANLPAQVGAGITGLRHGR